MKPYYIFLSILFVSGSISCVRLEKVKDGYTAYERKRYAQAIEYFERDYPRVREADEQISVAYRLADSYRNIGDYRNAAVWYKKAYEAGCREKCLQGYAEMMTTLEQYEQAIRAYEQLSKQGNRALYLGAIANARNAMLWSRESSGLVVEPAASVNSITTEYPTQLLENDVLLLSGDNPSYEDNDTYYWTGNSFFRMYAKEVSTGAPAGLPFQLDFDGNQADLVIYDRFAFFTLCQASDYEYDDYCKLYVTYNNAGYWTKPQVLPFVEPGKNYRHPSFDPTSQTLYFSANLELDTADINIYRVSYLGAEEWGLPTQVENANSSQGREVFPRIYGDTLYFSSDAAGMGGLDIFYIYYRNGRWSAPQNMKPPINSGGDDFAMTLGMGGIDAETLGYFASSRRGGTGKDDIYRFRVQELLEPATPEESDEGIDSIRVEVIVQERVFNTAGDPRSGVRLRQPLPNADLEVRTFPAVSIDTMTDRYGAFSINVLGNSVFGVKADKEGYFAVSREILLGRSDTTISIALEKIEVDQEYVLENIYFDFDKWDIRPDARPSLDNLATLLRDNPDIRIELSSHTDCRGTFGYNQDLSGRRAYASVQYLVEQGIDPDRMISKGYGESRPVADCDCDDCTEDQHQLNRRTAFRILP